MVRRICSEGQTFASAAIGRTAFWDGVLSCLRLGWRYVTVHCTLWSFRRYIYTIISSMVHKFISVMQSVPFGRHSYYSDLPALQS